MLHIHYCLSTYRVKTNNLCFHLSNFGGLFFLVCFYKAINLKIAEVKGNINSQCTRDELRSDTGQLVALYIHNAVTRMLFYKVPFRGIPFLCCFTLPCAKPIMILQLFSLLSRLAGCVGILPIAKVWPEVGK